MAVQPVTGVLIPAFPGNDPERLDRHRIVGLHASGFQIEDTKHSGSDDLSRRDDAGKLEPHDGGVADPIVPSHLKLRRAAVVIPLLTLIEPGIRGAGVPAEPLLKNDRIGGCHLRRSRDQHRSQRQIHRTSTELSHSFPLFAKYRCPTHCNTPFSIGSSLRV